jgi:hypothetical protein
MPNDTYLISSHLDEPHKSFKVVSIPSSLGANKHKLVFLQHYNHAQLSDKEVDKLL